ncbi:hypothetical protein BD410DRAFT_398391 [Rickenella mellea]|uniref:Uncharacterized protein n=1 Tax=Rickenella mellea TaxID=50990 RepID=A0A4Y7PXT2_9AGAM|nr:hypothetical protein BD410DRAFT_398391 [Rickenella mellea]
MVELGQVHSTIHTIAPEILSEIFIHCIPDHFQTSIHPFPTSMRRLDHAPLLIGRVCSRWRSVTISTPELWSSIVVGTDRPYKGVNFRKELEAVRLWVSRSRSLPLSIVIGYSYITSPGHSPDEQLLSQLFHTLIAQSRRWRSFRAKVPEEFVDSLLVPFRTGDLPQLVNFVCEQIRAHSIKLSSAPRLEFVYLAGSAIHIDFGNQINVIKSLDVTRYNDPAVTLGDLLICLTQCPLLNTLAISIGSLSQGNLQPQEIPAVIELPFLRYFNLYIHSDADPCDLFDRLFLPALNKLQLTMYHSAKRDWPHLGPLLKRSHSPLDDLSLVGVPMTESTLLECLCYAPGIRQLLIYGIGYTDTTLNSFTINHNSPAASEVLCPMLREITLASAHPSPEGLKAMILSRRCGRNQSLITSENELQCVSCAHSSIESILDDPEIARCVAEGLQLISR